MTEQRCWWCGDDPQYQAYHDEEWGMPVDKDSILFEKLCLEGFQAGLSWLTILRKRENFRKAFHGFDIKKVSQMNEKDVERLLQDQGIIRHRGKIEATINNAHIALKIQDECGSLANYFWRFVPSESERPKNFKKETLQMLAQTPTSKALAKDLKKRGIKFFGPTTAYAFMQAMGLVNDHVEGCATRTRVEKARAHFDYL